MYGILFFLVFIFSGCFKNNDSIATDKIEIQTIAKEVQIPKVIMSELEAEVRSESKTMEPVYLFMPLEVQFAELNEGVLKSPNMTFSFPKGGGYIDLKDAVSGFGSFYMRFPPEQFEKISQFQADLLHLYYISNSPAKKIGDEVFGLGCGKMIDLKKSFSGLKKANFLKLNTSDLRYLYVTSGRYIFILKQSTKVFITQLTVTDSRYSKELCLGADF